MKTISGFSKLSKRGKIKWIVENFFRDPETVMRELVSYWHKDEGQQKILDGFSENTISNFPMPYGVAPNFLIDGQAYAVPMVIEESSVVAAASSAAKFWMDRGGFVTTILGITKIGHVHFKWTGDKIWLEEHFRKIISNFKIDTADICKNMDARGGGLISLTLKDLTDKEENLFQIEGAFNTCDSMGANFINSMLEQYAKSLQEYVRNADKEDHLQIIMCILSNYTPDCVVRAEVACDVNELHVAKGIDPQVFAEKFITAIRIAEIDPYRATTHNKGIYNGIDSVVLATGNDFRAIEACGHAYASRNGQYASLSHCEIKENRFRFWLDIPLAIGTVGGLTKLHPMARRSLELLGNPDAKQLMSIIAATGLAQNFAAIRSLVTTGIQQGHMKMHLQNILNTLNASENESKSVSKYFDDKVVSFSAVTAYLEDLRKSN